MTSSSAQSPTYLFYDLETSGLNHAFDQILQFAAIRTDADFTELARHNFRVRLRPDVIPSPGALLTTNVSVREALTTGIDEYDAARKIHALVNKPGTISIGYNSLSFDDLFLRFTFYRNLLPPYDHQWKNGCHRLDLFPITIQYWLAASDRLTWPELDGAPTLRLEHLSRANGLADGPAHDALVDVEATVALARRLRTDEARWVHCLAFFDKQTFDDRLKQLPIYPNDPSALLVDGKFGHKNQFLVPALHLGQSDNTGNRHLWLRLDMPELQQATPDNLAETVRLIRQKPGEPPFMLPPEKDRLSDARRDITHANLERLKAQPGLLDTIRRFAHDSAYDSDTAVDADAALYANGFNSPETDHLCRRFHQAHMDEKVAMLADWPDAATRTLARRLLARNYGLGYLFPGYRTYARQVRDDAQPLLDYRGGARLTPQAALTRVEARRTETLTPRQADILMDLERYIRYQFQGQS